MTFPLLPLGGWRSATASHSFAAILVAALVTLAQVARLEPAVPLADAHGYASIAFDIHHHGTFTDGAELNPWPRADPPPGMFVAPLYPAFVAAVMAFDPGLNDTLTCTLKHRKRWREAGCNNDFGLLIPVQGAVAAIAAFLVFVAGRVVCGSYVCAWLAMLLALTTGKYAQYAVQFLTEILTFPLFTAFSIVMVLAWKRQSPWLWLAGGVLVGLCTLVRPSFAYLFYAGVVFAPVGLLVAHRGRLGRPALLTSMLVLGYGAVIAPWVIRNATLLGVVGITSGYASHELAYRLSYNAMSWTEWLVSFVYWLPDFGDSLAAALFDPSLYERLSFDHPDSYYRAAGRYFYPQTLAAAGGQSEHLAYLIREHMLAEPFKHIMVTFAILWRGLWVAKYWGLIAIICFVPAAVMAIRRRWSEAIVFALPPWYMAGFNAFVSVNVARYNLILIPCLAIAMAWIITRVAANWKS